MVYSKLLIWCNQVGHTLVFWDLAGYTFRLYLQYCRASLEHSSTPFQPLLQVPTACKPLSQVQSQQLPTALLLIFSISQFTHYWNTRPDFKEKFNVGDSFSAFDLFSASSCAETSFQKPGPAQRCLVPSWQSSRTSSERREQGTRHIPQTTLPWSPMYTQECNPLNPLGVPNSDKV